MFVIFGWGHTTNKVHGPAELHNCARCHNEQYWILQKSTEWFTLFFIPIIPYSTKHFEFCPICQNVVHLTKPQFEALANRAELNKQAASGQISREEFDARV